MGKVLSQLIIVLILLTANNAISGELPSPDLVVLSSPKLDPHPNSEADYFLANLEDFETYDLDAVDSLFSELAPEWTVRARMDSEQEPTTAARRRPHMLTNPQDAYIVRRKPAKLTCRTLHADKVSFRCNGEWVKEKFQKNSKGVDEVSDIEYLEGEIEIQRRQFEKHFAQFGRNGGFQEPFECECFAWAEGGGSVKSDKALVKLAYLKKYFPRQPSSEAKPVGSTVQLMCLPPEGEPLPEVFWKRDNKEIVKRSDPNVIVANDGSLILSAARYEDSGNYTCGARNVAGTRFTETINLRIYVNGGWSQWSRWSDRECSVMDCDNVKRDSFGVPIAPFQRRSRVCNNPRPLNRGEPCQGPSTQRKRCDLKCPVDGRYGQWSPWSPCSNECSRWRSRECDSPKPVHGGALCDETTKYQTENCSADLCGPTVFDGSSSPPQVASAGLEQKDIVYIGAGLSIFIIALLLCLIWVFYRKCRQGRKSQSPYYNSPPPDFGGLLGIGPTGIDPQTLLMRDDSLKKYPPPPFPAPSPAINGTLGRHPFGDPYFADGSRAPLLIDGISSNQSSNPPSIGSAGGGKNRSTSQSSSHNSSGVEEERPYASLYDTLDETERASPGFPLHLPANLDPRNVICATVGPEGDRLAIPDSGVSLLIPSGALAQEQDIYVAMCTDFSDRPRGLSDRETLISPVVLIGPPGVAFRKPVIVSVPHSAQIEPLDNWEIAVYASKSTANPDDTTVWEKAVTLGHETLNSELYCQFDDHLAHIMSDSAFTRFALVGKSQQYSRAFKNMALMVFAPIYHTTQDYSIRVYCVDDTPAMLKSVKLEEENLGGCMVHEPKPFSFQEGANVSFQLDEMGSGWRIKQGGNFQPIPGFHVWSGPPLLHCSFSLEQGTPTLPRASTPQVSCRLLVSQQTPIGSAKPYDNIPHLEQVLYLRANVNTHHNSFGTLKSTSGPATSGSPYHPHSRPDSSAQTVTTTLGSYGGYSSTALRPLQEESLRIPGSVKRRVAQCLNKPLPSGHDWRMLATKLHFDRYLNYFASRQSPTEQILDLWEARNRGPTALNDLIGSLKEMERGDAAALLEEVCYSYYAASCIVGGVPAAKC